MDRAKAASMGCHFKGPGGMPLPLHSDNGNGIPAPFPATSHVANVNYALTPCSREAVYSPSCPAAAPGGGGPRRERQSRCRLGAKQPYGWRHEGPDYGKFAVMPQGLYD